MGVSLLVEEIGEDHRPAASPWQPWSKFSKYILFYLWKSKFPPIPMPFFFINNLWFSSRGPKGEVREILGGFKRDSGYISVAFPAT